MSSDTKSYPEFIQISNLKQAAAEKLCSDFFEKMLKAAEDNRAGYCGPMPSNVQFLLERKLADASDANNKYVFSPVRMEFEKIVDQGVETDTKEGALVLFPWRNKEVSFTPRTPGNIQLPFGCTSVYRVANFGNQKRKVTLYDTKLDKPAFPDRLVERTLVSNRYDICDLLTSVLNKESATPEMEITIIGKENRSCISRVLRKWYVENSTSTVTKEGINPDSEPERTWMTIHIPEHKMVGQTDDETVASILKEMETSPAPFLDLDVKDWQTVPYLKNNLARKGYGVKCTGFTDDDFMQVRILRK